MNLQEIKANAPAGATHYCPENSDYQEHYLKPSVDDPSQGNLCCLVGKKKWDLIGHDPLLSECIDLREPSEPSPAEPCKQCAELVEVLELVNSQIYATTTFLGSPEYFEIRGVLCDAIAKYKENQ